MTLLIDAEAGVVTADQTEDQLAKFTARIIDLKRGCEDAKSIESGPCRMLDGTEISFYGNVGLQTDLDQVLHLGLAGVGLFRTEFLYLQSQERPDAESQRHLYAEMAERLGDRPLVIRTFDLGGDKLPPFVSLDKNLAPSSLNLRGLRFSLGEEHLLRAQLTAIVQVAQSTEVRILFPMVIGSDDFSQAIAVVEDVMKDCGALRRPPIGAMIETPAALFCLDEILELADFIAIGTNDLTQYLLAADRELSSESDAFTAMHPAVLRAIKQIMVAAEQWECPVTVCGEEAGEPEFAELLIGLGVRALSVSPSQASRLRAAIAKMDRMDATELVERALVCRSPREVRELFSAKRSSFDAKENQSSPHLLGVSP
jgi:phosphoenolpyruvate-protein kinase (PTS system EI component)